MRSLKVDLYGVDIGTLFEADNRYGMTFNERYVETTPPPVLSLSFLNTHGRPSAPKNTSLRLLPFFANLLPEPNSRLRQYLAAQSNVSDRDDMGLLNALGSDLPGAVTLVPDMWEPEQHRDQTRSDLRPLRFSLGGVQMKFSVCRDGNDFVLPQDGKGGTYILKLPDAGKPDLPQNEAAMMEFAGRCGIAVPNVQLIEASSVRGLPTPFADFKGPAYVIERFDRSPAGRIHIEDFAQITRVNPEDKYERTSFDNVMRVCSILGEHAVAEFVRRLVFTIAIANADMHLKNWSVRYEDRYRATLAPAYDYVCTAAYAGYDDALALPFAGVLQWNAVTLETFLRAARAARVHPHLVKVAVSDIKDRIENAWPDIRRDIPADIRKVVERQLSLPLFKAGAR